LRPKFNKVKDLLHNIQDEKMKGKKFKIEVARKVIRGEVLVFGDQ
jgi:hypothetical protein